MTKNQFKDNTKKKKVSSPKTKSPKKNPFKKINEAITSLLTNEKLSKSVGLFLLATSAFLLFAFVSFLFTWQVDQDIINNHWNNPEIEVQNWLGKIGAYFSHLFIFNGFGVSSFLFVFLSFIVGFRVLFKVKLLPLGNSIKHAIFSLLWLSIFLAYLVPSMPILGGEVGLQVNLWLSSSIGSIGTILFLALSLLIFLVVNFNISFNLLPAKLDTKEESEAEPTLKEEEPELVQNTIINDDVTPITVANEPTETVIPIPPTPEPIKDTTPIEEINPEESIELDATPPPPTPKTKDEEISFEVEEPAVKEEILSESELNDKVAEFGEYDPKLDLSSYQLPSVDLLKEFDDPPEKVTPEELEANKNRILDTLSNYNIKIASIKATIGPTVTLYEIVPEAGVRISKIKNLEDDIALSLAALGIRIIAPIPGKGTIGIEVPNQNPEIVSMKTAIASDKFQNAKMELPVVMGKTITNETFIFDLAKMPHLLMAGATGQGKSVGLNAVLTSLLYKKHPSQLKFVLVDPKKVELTLYNKIERHFLAKLPDAEDAIITDNQKVINTLNSLCIEMDQRYELLKNAMVRNIVEYNSKFIARKLNPENGHKFLPYIVLVIDEFADLIMTAGKEVETPIARLAQLARAIGIHLIIATQRPSANIITGIIKANFPGRIAFRVTSGIDSRTILDSSGADQLIGRGDMLISQGNDLTRVQCAFVDTPEVEAICEFIGEQRGYPEVFTLPEYVGESATGGSGTFDGEDRDVLFDDAARMLVQHQQGSASLLQRKMKIGYNRAGRLIDQMEEAGIIGPFEGSKARQVLISDLETLEQFLKDLGND